MYPEIVGIILIMHLWICGYLNTLQYAAASVHDSILCASALYSSISMTYKLYILLLEVLKWECNFFSHENKTFDIFVIFSNSHSEVSSNAKKRNRQNDRRNWNYSRDYTWIHHIAYCTLFGVPFIFHLRKRDGHFSHSPPRTTQTCA